MAAVLLRSGAVLGLLVLVSSPVKAQVPASVPNCGTSAADSTTASIVRPKYLKGPMPKYPPSLRLTSQGGEVRIHFTVGCDGRVDSTTVTVIRSTDSLFTRPALVSVVGSEYSPAMMNGHAVSYRLEQAVRFTITKGP